MPTAGVDKGPSARDSISYLSRTEVYVLPFPSPGGKMQALIEEILSGLETAVSPLIVTETMMAVTFSAPRRIRKVCFLN